MSKLSLLNNNGLEESIGDPTEFLKECREEWTRRSGLAYVAPKMKPDTVVEVGYTRLTPTGQQILYGSY